jgi:hypothetical protein
LPDEAVRFLVEEGLPVDAAPFLGLQPKQYLLRPVLQVWPFQIPLGERRTRLDRCFSIFSDGSGNPICLDVGRRGELVWLDHETELLAERWVNSSVQHFAEFLLLRLADRSARDLSPYEVIDPKAVRPGTFWHVHLAQG